MTKEKLKRYRIILSELELLKRQLEKIEPEYVMDSTSGSDKEFPYTKHKMNIEGYDLDSYKKKIARTNKKIIAKMNELVEEKDRLIEFIYNVKNSETRQILIYRYIDGLVWREIAGKMSYGASTIRLKHDNFVRKLKD